MNRFVKFNGYQHKVIARHAGKNYFLPLGLTLVNSFFGVELKPGRASRPASVGQTLYGARTPH